VIREHRTRSNEPATKGALRGLLTLGVLCIIIGLGLVVSDIQGRHRDAEFRDCVAETVTDQNAVLGQRGKLVERESHATQQIIENVFESSTREGALKAYRKYIQRLNRIERGREKHPIPDLPKGVCR
jgi:hypothetical protein